MAASVLDLPVREFSAQLAAKEPTPGGGSAAALAGALGAALVSMVCRYTVGREKYAEVEDAAQRVLARAEGLRADLETAAEADAAAYGSYSRAQSMPRETEAERAERDAALQAALRESTAVPLGVAERCSELLELAAEAAEIGNPYLISDAAVGAEMAAAACASAELNVRLNVGGLEDAAFAGEIRARLEALAARVGGRDLVERAARAVAERSGA
ncbi:MAG: cyclodeaminase/cyclohydrolase family protein [Actinobacteria bacterium]|nr:cyclodeaminase/cyclohydrolase family protein [Actinomycetota bacterium]